MVVGALNRSFRITQSQIHTDLFDCSLENPGATLDVYGTEQ